MDDLFAEAEKRLTLARWARMRLVASQRLRGLTVAFDGLHDPHNISAAMRSCDAFGVHDVHLVGDTRLAPVNRGITMGCHRWLACHWHDTAGQCADALRAEGFRVLLATPADKSLPLEQVDFSRRVALVFGNEHAGVSSEFRGLADGFYHVPMYGFVESLNVSVSVAVSLAHAAAARRKAVGGMTDMSPAETRALLEVWLRRALGDCAQSP